MYLLLLFLLNILQYESKTFLTFIKNDDLNQNHEPKQRYTCEERIGKGGNGIVSLFYDNKLKKDVVIKKIMKYGKDEEKKFNREIEAMKNIKCQNTVEYYDHYDDKDFYYIVMEKCHKDLSEFIKDNKGNISNTMIKNILLQLNEAFKMMYSKNLIHRDLKPQNILIKKDDNINDFIFKIADFGLSRVFDNNNFSTKEGTQLYSAPEQLDPLTKNYEPTKCDLWAIGVIIYELKFNEVPILSFYDGTIPDSFGDELLDDLVKRLIVKDPNKRIDWKDYFDHPFFKN